MLLCWTMLNLTLRSWFWSLCYGFACCYLLSFAISETSTCRLMRFSNAVRMQCRCSLGVNSLRLCYLLCEVLCFKIFGEMWLEMWEMWEIWDQKWEKFGSSKWWTAPSFQPLRSISPYLSKSWWPKLELNYWLCVLNLSAVKMRKVILAAKRDFGS